MNIQKCKKVFDYQWFFRFSFLFVFLVSCYLESSPSKQMIEDAYTDISGYGIDSKELETINQSGASATYGEITPQSLAAILKEITITKDDVFYDLGSGVGKVTLQVYLETPVKKSVGVELSHTRTSSAKLVLSRMKDKGLIKDDRIISFIEGDMLKVDISDATIIFMCSTCFPDAFLKQVQSKLLQGKDKITVITLKDLPPSDKFLLVKKLTLEMSWTKQSNVFIYQIKK